MKQTMKQDSRGRVRFGHSGYRFEVTKAGKISVYDRTAFSYASKRRYEDRSTTMPTRFLNDDGFLAKLLDAKAEVAMDVWAPSTQVHRSTHQK